MLLGLFYKLLAYPQKTNVSVVVVVVVVVGELIPRSVKHETNVSVVVVVGELIPQSMKREALIGCCRRKILRETSADWL